MTIVDELAGCDTDGRLDGQVVMVTGATSGTGLETARALAARGARVIITGRRADRLAAARSAVLAAAGRDATADRVTTRTLDYGSLDSVRHLARQTALTEPRLHALVNNAGAIGLDDRLTADGLQLTMQVNYFGAFLLTYLLFPLLRASAPSRVVNVSSLALLLGDTDLSRFNTPGQYSAFGYYCNAKLASVLFTVEMAKRTAGSGVAVYSVDPGLGKSDFFRHLPPGLVQRVLSAGLLKVGRPLSDVARTPVYLAAGAAGAAVSGDHYRDCAPFYSSWYAHDAALTHTLWERTKRWVNITAEQDWETK